MLQKLTSAFNAVRYQNWRRWSLTLAESLDAYRVVQHGLIIAYGYLAMKTFIWYTAIPRYVVTRCDAALMTVLVDKKIKIEDAKLLACNIHEIVGGPTSQDVAVVTAVIGLAAVLFAFYSNSGRKWGEGLPPDIDNNPKLLESRNSD